MTATVESLRAVAWTGDVTREKVTGVTVTYNSADYICRLLESTAGQLDEHIVIDNGSTDATCDLVAQAPNVTLLARRDNVGFAGGVNQALRERKESGAVLLLNPDVQVMPGAVGRLAETASQTSQSSIVVPRLMYENGAPQDSVRTFPTVGSLLARRTAFGRTMCGQRILGQHLCTPSGTHASYVDWAIGAAMFVPSVVLGKIGPMNDKYFLYCEDVDWCLKSWRAAHGVVYAPSALMIHSYGRGSRKTWSVNRRATRLHWRSITRFAATNLDVVFLGHGPTAMHGMPALDAR